MKLLAADPGLTGALAAYDTAERRMDIHAMPTLQREMSSGKLRLIVDEDELITLMRIYADMGFTHLVKEKVGGMPGQNAARAFMFGAYDAALRIAAKAAGILVVETPPAVWKAAMRAPKNKKAARHRASELLPGLKHMWPLDKDHGKAEAALLALYAERKLNGGAA